MRKARLYRRRHDWRSLGCGMCGGGGGVGGRIRWPDGRLAWEGRALLGVSLMSGLGQPVLHVTWWHHLHALAWSSLACSAFLGRSVFSVVSVCVLSCFVLIRNVECSNVFEYVCQVLRLCSKCCVSMHRMFCGLNSWRHRDMNNCTSPSAQHKCTHGNAFVILVVA